MTATDENLREAATALEALKASGVRVKRGTTARTGRPPNLPRYTGPLPRTVEEGDALIKELGRTYSGLPDEATAAIMHLRGDADRFTGEEGPAVFEGQAPGIPDGEDLEHDQAEASTAAAEGHGGHGPEGALARLACQSVPEQDGPDQSGAILDVGQSGTPGDSDDPSGAIRIADQSGSPRTADQSESVPGPDQEEAASTPTAAPAGLEDDQAEPVREPAGEGFDPIRLFGDVEMRVWPEDRGRFPIEFLRGGKRVGDLFETKGEPWLNERLQDRIAAALNRALDEDARKPEFARAKVRTAFDEIRKTIEENPKKKSALTSKPVRVVLKKTRSVDVYPSKEPKGPSSRWASAIGR